MGFANTKKRMQVSRPQVGIDQDDLVSLLGQMVSQVTDNETLPNAAFAAPDSPNLGFFFFLSMSHIHPGLLLGDRHLSKRIEFYQDIEYL